MRINGIEIDDSQLAAMSQHGNQMIVNAGARVLGMGTLDDAPGSGFSFPWWSLVGLGLVVGVAAGAAFATRYPSYAKKVVG